MTLIPGTRLGPYEVATLLGAGGMGEVYRARDPRLGRDVAIKVLPASFSADPDRLRRFEHEARAAGVLNHPNITAVYDIGTHDGSPYVVEELLEGETLRSELAGERLPVRRAIDYALQTARGLAAAHEKGIVHRDLKPENLFVTKDGRVKILDFGLAKLVQKEPEIDSRETSLPTATIGTEPGIVLGTLGYMSPEQVRGRPADARSDIFALGAILYEMLSGRRAFQGDSSADTMSAILREDPPDLSVTNQAIAPGLERIIRHCLEKNPERRFHSAHDVALALEALSDPSAASAVLPTIAARPLRRLVFPALLGVLVALAAGTALVLTLRPAPSRARVLRLSIPPPEGMTFNYIGRPIAAVVSPDGNYVTFGASDTQGIPSGWIRPLSAVRATRLEIPQPASLPFWSPDSRYLGFIFPGPPDKVKKIPVTGGAPITVATLPDDVRRGWGNWSSRGDIIFSRTDDSFIIVRESGGPPVVCRPRDGSSRSAHRRFPSFLPDGTRFIYLRSEQGGRSLWTASLDGTAKQILSDVDSHGIYVPPGYLLYTRGKTLLAQRFDPKRLELSGEAVPVGDDVAPTAVGLASPFSVSRDVLAYLSAQPLTTEFAWYDRGGKPLGRAPVPAGSSPELSPDGTRVLIERRGTDADTRDLWMVDLLRGTASRFTSDSADDSDPVWSPDGERILFSSDRGGNRSIYEKGASSDAPERKAFEKSGSFGPFPNDWSRDGRFLLVNAPPGLVVSSPDGKNPVEVAERGGAGRFSPDGRWIAYQSEESGRYEIYVRAFPSGGRWQVSTEGGYRPRWSADGRELFYISPERKLMSVAIVPGEPFRASAPRELFQTRISGPLAMGIRCNYAVAPDGRFLIVNDTSEARPVPMTIVINWQMELAKK